MARETKIPTIPSVPAGLDPGLAQFLSSVKEMIEVREGQRGQTRDRFIRRADFSNASLLLDLGLTYSSLVNSSTDPIEPPTGFTVVKGHWCNYLSWTNPVSELFAGIEVWVNTSNDRSDATLTAVLTSPAAAYTHYMSDYTNPHYYWIRARSFNPDVYSTWLPTDQMGGEVVEGDETVGETIEKMIDVLKGTDPATYAPATTYYEDDLVKYVCADSGLRRFKCIDDDSGTGITGVAPTDTDHWEQIGILLTGEIDGVETVGVDGNLVVDGTILARCIAADQIDTDHMNADNAFIGLTIQSTSFETGVQGWQINKDGDVEFNSGTFRGTTLWSAVSGANKPDDNADVTGSNTAADTAAVNGLDSTTLISGGKIGTGLVVADSIYVDSLSALNADLGTITAGNITLNTSGFIRTSGKDNYSDTTAGMFLGYDTDAYKVNIGDATKSIKWDGSDLIVTGKIIGPDNLDDYTAGDAVVAASFTEASNNTNSMVKIKEAYVSRAGTIRVKFSMKTSTAPNQVNAQVYRNGGAVGTMQTSTSASYAEKSEDISGWSKGDLVQVYARYWSNPGTIAWVRDFKICIGNPISEGINLD